MNRLPKASAAIVAVGAIQLLIAAIVLGQHGAPGAFGGDFIAYYAAGQHVLHHGWNGIYDLAAQQAAEAPLLARSGLGPSAPTVIPFNYPAPAALLFVPFALLPPGPAVALWVLLNGALVLLTARWLVGSRRSGLPTDQNWSGAISLFAPFLCLPVDWGLLSGQPVGVTLALGALTFAGWREQRDRSAGLALALLALVKPQLAVAPVLGLLALGRRRALGAFACLGGALLAGTLALVGPGGVVAYLRLLATMDPARGNPALAVRATAMVNWRALLVRVPGLSEQALLVATMAATLVTLVVAVFLCRRWWDHPGRCYVVITAGGLLASYHSHYQDLVLLFPPLIAEMAIVVGVAHEGVRAAHTRGAALRDLAPGWAHFGDGATLGALTLLVIIPGIAWAGLGVISLAWLPAFTTLAIPGLLLLAAASWRPIMASPATSAGAGAPQLVAPRTVA